MSGKSRRQTCTVEVEDGRQVDGINVQTAVFHWQDGAGQPYGSFITPVVAQTLRPETTQKILHGWIAQRNTTFEDMCTFTKTTIPNQDTRVVLRLDGGLVLDKGTQDKQVRVRWERAQE